MTTANDPDHPVTETVDERDGWFVLFEESDDLLCSAWARVRIEDAVELEAMR